MCAAAVVCVVAFAALSSSGCTRTERRGPVVSTVTKPASCGAPRINGELGTAEGRVLVTLSGERTCAETVVTTYRQERWLKFDTAGFWLTTFGVGLATAGLTMGIFAASARPEDQSSSVFQVGAALVSLTFLGGMGAGALTGHFARRDLPPTTQHSENPGLAEVRAVIVTGPLVSSSGAQRWALTESRVELELDTLDANELESASVGGLRVEWTPAANERLAGLSHCRRALSGWQAKGALDCARVEPAWRCAEAGWSLAEPVLAAARTSCPERANTPQ